MAIDSIEPVACLAYDLYNHLVATLGMEERQMLKGQKQQTLKTKKKRNNSEIDKPRSKAEETWGQYPKSISRIETIKHCAWYVRIYFEGAYVRKTFSDGVYGGKENAFREALQWRDEMEQRMGKPRTERSVRKKTVVDERDIGI